MTTLKYLAETEIKMKSLCDPPRFRQWQQKILETALHEPEADIPTLDLVAKAYMKAS